MPLAVTPSTLLTKVFSRKLREPQEKDYRMKKFIFISLILAVSPVTSAAEKAIFSGGCFWCMEEAFQEAPGVTTVRSGFAGGSKKNPSYQEVASGKTRHIESVEVEYDPKKTSYSKLLDIFWKNIDPLNAKGQFCDEGNQYTSGIFYLNETQQKEARESLEKVKKLPQFQEKNIVTFIRPATPFYVAGKEHQDYYKEHSIKYKFYKYNCGRAQRLEEIW